MCVCHIFSIKYWNKLNVWNALPDSVDFTSLNKFKQSISRIDFSDHLMCLKVKFLFLVCTNFVQ